MIATTPKYLPDQLIVEILRVRLDPIDQEIVPLDSLSYPPPNHIRQFCLLNAAIGPGISSTHH